RVFSVIGRFLEHSRIYYFGRGATDPVDGKSYIGSADWMYRNLNNRIETVVPVDDPGAKSTLWRILNTILEDQVQTWELSSSGEYALKKSAKVEIGVQEKLIAAIGGHNVL